MTDDRDPWMRFFKVKFCPLCDEEEAVLIPEDEPDCDRHDVED